MNLKNLLDTGNETQKQGLHPGFETNGRCHQKFKIKGFTKSTYVLQKFKKKKFDPRRVLFVTLTLPKAPFPKEVIVNWLFSSTRYMKNLGRQ